MVAARSIELVTFPENLRVRSFLHSVGDVGLHLHGAFELIVMLKGRLFLQTDRETRILSEGDVGLAHCWQPHGTQRVGEANRMLVVQIDPAIASADIDFQRRRFTISAAPKADVQRELSAMAARLHLDAVQQRSGWALQVESQALRMLGFLLQLDGGVMLERSENLFYPQESNEIGAALRRAMDFIVDHYDQPISLGDVAEAHRTSADYLARLFRSQAKTNFSRFLSQLRLIRAADRLRSEPRVTVLSIAMDVGFPNITAFNTAFRRSYGTTPTEWRRSAAPHEHPSRYPIPSDHEDLDKLSDLVAAFQATRSMP